jgi:hypothetical protein
VFSTRPLLLSSSLVEVLAEAWAEPLAISSLILMPEDSTRWVEPMEPMAVALVLVLVFVELQVAAAQRVRAKESRSLDHASIRYKCDAAVVS